MTDDLSPNPILIASLTSAADAVDARPQWSDLAQRIEHNHRRRRRVLAGLAVVGITGASFGGYALGIRSADDQVTTATAAPSIDKNQASSSGPIGPIGPIGPLGSSLSGGGIGASTFRNARDTASGVRIRVWDQPAGFISSPAPEPMGIPLECSAESAISIELSDPEMVATSGTMIRPAASRPVTTLMVAGNGGPNVFAVVVTTGAGTSNVTANFPGGTDSVSAIDGVAVLATTLPAGELASLAETRVSIDGAEPTEVDQASLYDNNGQAIYERQLDCSPVLPQPGEQPADPAAARAAVLDTWSKIVDEPTDIAAKTELIDDTTGIAGAAEQAKQAFPDAAANATFELVEMVFTAPDRVAVKYNVKIPPGSGQGDLVNGMIGEARLIDGQWKATRASVCALLSKGGGSCDPGGPSFPLGDDVMAPTTTDPMPGG